MVSCVSLDRVPLPAEALAFFRAIKERPDDDTPRLVFADWLHENGDAAAAARGEFLRLSVLRHRLPSDDPHYQALKRREGELFRAYGWSWLGPFADAARAWTFERGMIQLKVLPKAIRSPEVSAWVQTGAAFWIDTLKLPAISSGDCAEPGRDIDLLIHSPLLPHLTRLDASDQVVPLGLLLLFRAIRAGNLPFLRQLLLPRCRLIPRQVLALARCRELGRLTLLDLRYTGLGDIAAQLLAGSPYLKNGTILLLEHNRFSSQGMALLRRAYGDRVRL